MRSISLRLFAAAACCIPPIHAASSSPFTVSSPSASKNWKIKLRSELKDGDNKDVLTLPKVELGIPLAPDLDFTIAAQYRTVDRTGRVQTHGLGDVSVKSKWNFHKSEGGGLSLAVEPKLSLPTGDASRSLGEGDAVVELPFIVGYKRGAWELGTEIGYNHVFGRKDDEAYIGVLALRRLTPSLRLGAELVATTPHVRFSTIETEANVGMKWALGKRLELKALAGRTLHKADHSATNKFKLGLDIKI
ncbi:transporter [Sphingosinicella microcystinivorans]|uniref:transporter n=1 Tax=Sphingosinicella microcystinivorans TaxID=335406 RepID=UPI0022F3B4CA|nr:transporter [Sphingosinicella microcystinivorans]WBX84229.1 transporter [Sphingosinicella microcystinivorans]